ncbi:hypothetical protein J6590_005966 [Homalodisca vitripennis]|nr:hypothetical protein J6590_005966 [Homalodisca vitripennis]
MSQMSKPRNTSDQGERFSFNNTSGSTAGSNMLKLDGNTRENVQLFKMFSNYSLATRLYDKDHSVQVASMMSIIGDEASRIIYRLMDELERTMVNYVLCVLEQKLPPDFNIWYERYLFNLTKHEMEETYQEYFMRLMTQMKLCDFKRMEDELMLGCGKSFGSKNMSAANKRSIEMRCHELPAHPFERISMGVLQIKIYNRLYFFEIDKLNDLTPKITILVCKKNFRTVTVLKDNAIKTTMSNKKAEVSIRPAKDMIKKAIKEKIDFYKMLLLQRKTPNKTNFNSAQRMMCHWLRCQLPKNRANKVIVDPANVQESLTKNRTRSAETYNKNVVQRRDLAFGVHVSSPEHKKKGIRSERPRRAVTLLR